ncbi:MAG TPA: hypothetical protein ENG61_02095 [Candidatus Korarchaeota archaeon]|nr:hypothetical protein [Candidatus Korarchaeota archaeon]
MEIDREKLKEKIVSVVDELNKKGIYPRVEEVARKIGISDAIAHDLVLELQAEGKIFARWVDKCKKILSTSIEW